MSEKLDVIIFGATGFTGQEVVKNAVEILKDHKWGIAGRNQKKLENVLNDISSKIGKDLSQIPIIIADTSNKKSIEDMAKRCKVVLNCCGPYRYYGEVVVKACIDAGTHHLDVSGEPQYFNKMQLKYSELAKEKGSYVVSTCAFESIPPEMGVVFTENSFEGTVNSIEMFWENKIEYKDKSSRAILHYGTWESAIVSFNYLKEMLVLQKQIDQSHKKLPELKPKLKINPLIQKRDFSDNYFIPFPATDRNIVKNSQAFLYEFEGKRPIQFESYVGFRSLWTLFLVIIAVFFIAILSQFKFTRKLLLKYPHIFSGGLLTHNGPTEANQDALHFSMTFKAKGWSQGTPLTEAPNKELLTRVSGYSPFYGLTSVSLLSAAKVILTESAKLPGSGGVLSPAAAFARTSLIEKLRQHKYGLKFEVLK